MEPRRNQRKKNGWTLITIQFIVGLILAGFALGYHIPQLINFITVDSLGGLGLLLIVFGIFESLFYDLME